MTWRAAVTVAAAHSVLWRVLLPVRVVAAVLAWLIARLTQRADARALDAAAEAEFARSSPAHGLTALAAAIARAWRSSAARRYGVDALRSYSAAVPTERVRLAGLSIFVASLTVLVLRYAASRPAPMTWLVPSAAAVCAVVVIVWAPGIAAALSSRKH